MPRTKSIRKLADRAVNHDELRVLVEHISTLIAAQEVRIQALEQALALGVVVDQEVAAAAREFIAIRNKPGAVERALRLVQSGDAAEVEGPGTVQ